MVGLYIKNIDIRPLLTIGGVSSIIVGLAARPVIENMISGINLVRK